MTVESFPLAKVQIVDDTLPIAFRRLFSIEFGSMSLPPILSSDMLTAMYGDCEPILVRPCMSMRDWFQKAGQQ